MSKKILHNILPSITGFLFILSLSVVLILNFRPLYQYDMRSQHLSETYGLSEEEILSNYDALIDYNSIFYQGALHFPTLPMSKEGEIHFQEVKQIFDAIQILLIVTSLTFLPLAARAIRMKSCTFLLLIPGITGIVAAAVLAGALIDWEGFFVAFHQLAFQNDYWLFDPETDPIINLLPDLYFFHCLAGILLCMAILLGFCLLLHHILQKRSSKKYPYI